MYHLHRNNAISLQRQKINGAKHPFCHIAMHHNFKGQLGFNYAKENCIYRW